MIRGGCRLPWRDKALMRNLPDIALYMREWLVGSGSAVAGLAIDDCFSNVADCWGIFISIDCDYIIVIA